MIRTPRWTIRQAFAGGYFLADVAALIVFISVLYTTDAAIWQKIESGI